MHIFSTSEIKNIIGDIEIGFVVYIHKKTGKITSAIDFETVED